MCVACDNALKLISDKFPHSALAVRNADNKTITLAKFTTLAGAVEWYGKHAEEYQKPKWDFREIWVE